MNPLPYTKNNWQMIMKDTASTLKYLFDSKECSLCDAVFELVDSDGILEVVSVHRFVLAARSSVFAAMFYGPLAEKNMPISVTDIPAEVFKALLQYLYKDDASCVNESNVLPLLYTAHKYDIEALKELCSRIASQGLTTDIVFHCIEQADMYNVKQLTNACYKLIDANTTKILCSDQFLQQPKEVVNAILKRSSLAADRMPERCIYKAVLRWALVEADRKEVKGDILGDRIRESIGETLYQIRFPLMTAIDIVQARKDGILSAEETADLLAYLLRVQDVPTRFSYEPRLGHQSHNYNANYYGRGNYSHGRAQCGMCKEYH